MATRRDMLAGITAAAFAAPFAGAAVAAQPSHSAWNAALVAYDRAKADADRAHEQWKRAAENYTEIVGRDPWTGSMDTEAARLTGFHQLNHHIDDWGDRLADAGGALIEMPAPDHGALLWKVEHLWGDDPTGSYCEEWMEIVLADFRRFLSVGRA